MSSDVPAELPDGPLAGLLVVDLTHAVAGPFATMHMADHGARVVKVERAGGDSLRYMPPVVDGQPAYFGSLNRGKSSVVLDLRDDADLAVLREMARRADVLVENFSAGVMERLGLGYAALSQVNPRLVYASLSGYGQTGPMADRPAFDLAIQATTGHMALSGEPGGGPVKTGTVVADLVAGLYLYVAVTTALLGRERTGRGTYVDLAMYDAMLSMLEGNTVLTALTGGTPPRVGNGHAFIAPFNAYAAADRAIVVCCVGDVQFRAFCDVAGRPDLAADERFRSAGRRVRNREAVDAEVAALVATRPAADWCRELNAAGVPAGLVADVAEALADPHVAARGMLTTVGGVAAVDNPVVLTGYARPSPRPPSPGLDEHGAELRAEFRPA